MTWRNRYWDVVSNFYWNPNYIGLQSIQLKKLEAADDCVRVPLSMLNTSGPLYTRVTKLDEMVVKLGRTEEILGHVFNIAFAIAPDALIQKLFGTPLGFSDIGPFASFGQQDIINECGLHGKNVGQHDALFLSDSTAIAIELKTGAKSSANQIMKYVALFGRLSNRRPELRDFGLVFICPQRDAPKLLASCGVADGAIQLEFIDAHLKSVNPDVRSEILSCRADIARLLRGLKITVITWTAVHDELCSIRERLDQKDACQQSLYRLLDGFIQQLEGQDGTDIPAAQIESYRPLFSGEKEMRVWIGKLDDEALLTEPDRRKALSAYVSSTSWGTRGVLRQCMTCTLVELEDFVAALKDEVSPISLNFRWASDEGAGAFFI
jgi:hypothetical protein